MLLIIELLFLVAGLWAVISGKIPEALFKLLFGKGEYAFTSTHTRLFGLLLLSPLPVSFLASLLNSKSIGYAIVFEYVYIFAVIIISIFIARRARLPEMQNLGDSQTSASPSQQKPSHYGMRLLVIFGLVILSCATITSAGALLITIISSVTAGTHWTGNFWEDIFPFILMIVITGIGLLGIFKLTQILRQKSQ